MQMMDGEYACAAIIRKKKTNGYVNVVACRALKGILFKGAESLKRKKIFNRKKKKVWEEPSTFKAEATTTMTTTTTATATTTTGHQ